MKIFIVVLSLFACSYADVSELGYEYQEQAVAEPVPIQPERIYLPADAAVPESGLVDSYGLPPHSAAEPDNSYVPPPAPVQPEVNYISAKAPVQQETIHAAPVPDNSYVPPEAIVSLVNEPVNTYIPPAAEVYHEPGLAAIEEVEQTPEDGYHYKAVRRVVHRHRA